MTQKIQDSNQFRIETDTMGIVRVPEWAYYGPQTQRAVDNFPISGLPLPKDFIYALALIKECAARVNHKLAMIGKEAASAIETAAREVMAGRFSDHFPVDVFQTGSGTSTNMNINEVIASRANEIITGRKGGKSPVHPNDHVNLCQSSNDVVPSALHTSAAICVEQKLIPALETLHSSLVKKSEAFHQIRKLGRTHLQDAVPMTLGQEFSGYARQVFLGMARVKAAETGLFELALGGTAVGTGLNAHPEFASHVIQQINSETGLSFREAENHFEAQAAQDASVEMSGALKTLAVSIIKIANDIRWLGSGPRCGIGEIRLPALQPGSSIMPGKVNPVMAEAVTQVCYQVIGNDTAIVLGAQSGNFELNVSLPLIAYNLLQSITILANVCLGFATQCIDGIGANQKHCAATIEKSLALVTNLVPEIGYDRAAALAKTAYETNRTVRQAALENRIVLEKRLEELIGPDFSLDSDA